MMLFPSWRCSQVPHLESVHLVTIIVGVDWSLWNLALVRIFFKFGGCLLLLIILMLSTTLLSLLLCLKMGRVFFIIGKILGLCGLYVDTKAKMFLSCVFAFTFLSSPCGMSLALLVALIAARAPWAQLPNLPVWQEKSRCESGVTWWIYA